MKLRIGVLAAVSLAVPLVRAQMNGSIQGHVYDPQGAAVPNVSVKLSGAGLQGEKTATTDQNGLYIFLGLPTGQMHLEASVPGFETYKGATLDLRAGLTLTIDIHLKLGEVTTKVDVATEAPIIDITNPEERFNISGTFLNTLPLSMRQNWDAIWFMVPGAYTMGRTGPDQNIDPAIHGASSRSNVYKLDGFEIGNAFTNQGYTTQFSTEAIQDVYIKTSGPDASTPLGEGGYINVVTKSGGNKFHGTAGILWQPRSFNWNNVPGGVPSDQGLIQPDASFGGPIYKDRSWFFVSYRYVDAVTGVAKTATAINNFKLNGFTVPTFDLQDRDHRFLSKLTQRIGEKHTLTFSFLTDAGLQLNSNARDQSTLVSTINIHSGGPTYRANWTSTLTPRLLLTFQYGYRAILGDVDPLGGQDPSLNLYNSTTISSGNPVGQQILLYAGNRSGAASGSKDKRSQHEGDMGLTYVTDRFWGQHTFDTGLQLKPRTQDQGTTFYPNSGLSFIDEVRTVAADGSIKFVPFHWQYISPTRFPFGGTGRLFTLGGYLQDKWRPTSRLTISLGIRFDNQSSHDLFGVNEINTVSTDPRVSAAYSLSKTGRDVIRAGYARVHDVIYLQTAPSFGSITPTRTDVYSTKLDGVQDKTLVTPGVFTRPTQFDGLLDPNLHAPYVDEFHVGYTRQLPKQFVVESAYVWKRFHDVLGSQDRNIIYQNGLFQGYTNVAFNALTVPVNLSNAHQTYQDFEISVNRNVGRLMLLSSYTYQHEVDEGIFPYDNVNRYLAPSSWYYNDKLAQPHLLRLVGYYRLPWKFTTSVVYQLQSGVYSGALIKTLPGPDPALGPTSLTLSNGRVVSNPLATTTRLVGPVGKGQLEAPMVPRLNVRFGKLFTIREGRTLEANADFQNLTNNGVPLFFASGATNTSLSTFGTFQSTTQSPRGAELSAVFRF